MNKTGCVYLRPLAVADAEVSWRWRNDADLWRYTGNRPNMAVTEQMEREWAERVIADNNRRNFAICLSPSGRYIGNIYLVNIVGTTAELGMFIGEKDCQGRGYARAALNILKEMAHKEFNIDQIKINVRSDNLPALITYLKVGAELENCGWLGLKLDTLKVV